MFIIRRWPVLLSVKIRCSYFRLFRLFIYLFRCSYFKQFQYQSIDKTNLLSINVIVAEEKRRKKEFKCDNSLLFIALENETMDV